MTGLGDLIPFKRPSIDSNQKDPREFQPTRTAPEEERNEFKMTGGILGAIGGTPLVQLEKIFESSHFDCFAKLQGLNQRDSQYALRNARMVATAKSVKSAPFSPARRRPILLNDW